MKSPKPNVILFFTDQQRWDTVGLHGNPLGLTPNFDRLARAGTHIAHSYTCQPVCGPARSCLQTGCHATTTGVYRNGLTPDKNLKTLAQCFREGGYTTGYIGKWHLASSDPVLEKERGGYEFWRGANALEHTSDAYDFRVFDNDNDDYRRPGYRVDGQTDTVIDFIRDHTGGDKPFYLMTSYLEPHHQNRLDDYPPPDGYREQYTSSNWIPPDLQALDGSAHRQLPGYYGMVKRLDEALGRIYDVLKSLGQLDNTIILFTSDHGCHFKTRNGEYKRSCHDSSIRVPTFFYGPGFMSGGERSELVSLIDLPPTLLEACGLPVPAQMEGSSLLPRLRDPGASWRDEVFVQISESQIGRALRTRRWTYSVEARVEGNPWKAPQDSKSYHEEFLYDNEVDPYQLNNLAGIESHRPVMDRLKTRLLSRIEEVEGKKPRIYKAKARGAGQLLLTKDEINA